MSTTSPTSMAAAAPEVLVAENVAEALQRVCSVSISRKLGEGGRVSIRGTAANLTCTLSSGHAIATADWLVLDQLAATRRFNYLMPPI